MCIVGNTFLLGQGVTLNLYIQGDKSERSQNFERSFPGL